MFDEIGRRLKMNVKKVVKGYSIDPDNPIKLNKYLHVIGEMVYHSQDKEFRPNVNIFRPSNSYTTMDYRAQAVFEVNDMATIIRSQRTINICLKLEMIEEKYEPSKRMFVTSLRFGTFSTFVETNKISTTKKGYVYREQHIPLVSSYHVLNDRWKRIDFKVLNKYLRIILKGEELDYKLDTQQINNIQEILSLLFVCETARNHCMYLMTPIFLEMMEVEDKKSKVKFPMAISGAVNGSRFLGVKYFKYLQYKYDNSLGDGKLGDALLIAENELFTEFLKSNGIKNNEIDKTNQCLENLILNWYGIKIVI